MLHFYSVKLGPVLTGLKCPWLFEGFCNWFLDERNYGHFNIYYWLLNKWFELESDCIEKFLSRSFDINGPMTDIPQCDN